MMMYKLISSHVSRDVWNKYIDVFLLKNQQLNLSAIRDADGVFVKHVCDALEVQVLEKQMETLLFTRGIQVLDVGTGGGIPLLPLALAYPNVHFTGLDSVRKKTEAVQDMATILSVKNVSLVWSRAEEYKHEPYDILTARAVAFSDQLFKRCYWLVKKWWYFILYKMFSEQEEARLDSYISQKKMTMIRKHYYKLFEDDIQRVIYVVKK
jgi:16S rRNA (guanine527-N7)-methyltransferase